VEKRLWTQGGSHIFLLKSADVSEQHAASIEERAKQESSAKQPAGKQSSIPLAVPAWIILARANGAEPWLVYIGLFLMELMVYIARPCRNNLQS
jgi:hypothetical protein